MKREGHGFGRSHPPPGLKSQDVVSLDIFVNGSAIGDLASPIHFTIPAELAGPADPTCAYLDEERQEWSTVGVSLINVTNTSLLCSTTHLSLFGGIMRSIEQALLCSNAAAIFSIEGLRSLTSRLWIFEWPGFAQGWFFF